MGKAWMRGLARLAIAVALVACQVTPARHEPSGEPVLPGTAMSAAVYEYFHHRKLALVARDIEFLWSRFPHLRTAADLETGVNVEEWLATKSAAARSLADVSYDLDRYDRMRVSVSSDETVVRVHGLEMYVASDFSTSGGEFILDLYLRYEPDQGRWSVLRTDEMTIVEYHEGRQRSAP